MGERHILTLEDAVRKMTSLPASRLGIKKRGLLRPGYFADVIAFDPDAFRDEASYESPKRLASGLSLLLVNGEAAGRFGKIIDGR